MSNPGSRPPAETPSPVAAIIGKPVKGLTDFFGNAVNHMRGPEALKQAFQRPEQSPNGKSFKRYEGSLPYQTTPRQMNVPEFQMIPEDTHTSRVCLNEQVEREPLYNRSWPVASHFFPLTCPTDVDPRRGMQTKTFTATYVPDCDLPIPLESQPKLARLPRLPRRS
jgi:hypothetical protein